MSEAQVPGQTTRGVVIGIDHGVATVLIGDRQDEWDFPMQLLPEGTTEDSILLLTGEGYGLEVVEHVHIPPRPAAEGAASPLQKDTP